MRNRALTLFEAAIAAADPVAAVNGHMRQAMPMPDGTGRLVVIALGKAAPAMMQAATAHIAPGTDWSGLVVTHVGVTHSGQDASDGPITTIIGGHPVPTDGSARAGAAILDSVATLGAQDRVLALISGGGSALAVAPPQGLNLADKQALNTALLESGMAINQMNEIRQACSRLKGGGLLRRAAPAPVTALILSDVIGDDLSAIASGPTVAPIGTPASALALLDAHKVAVPPKIRAALDHQIKTVDLPPVRNILIGSNTKSVNAVAAHALAHDVVQVDTPIVGDVSQATTLLMAHTAQNFVAGGETTVVIKGTGKGGRNQDLALRFALAAQTQLQGPWTFLSGGTDGRDGPTDAAGAVVDQDTLARMRKAGVDPAAMLANNDAYHALDASHDLIRIPATGTNVADIQIFLRG